jgi:hypothetical protein
MPDDDGGIEIDGAMEDSGQQQDAGMMDSGTDTDAGVACDIDTPGSMPGAACRQGSSCNEDIGGNSACRSQTPAGASFPTVKTNADGGVIEEPDGGFQDGGPPSVPIQLFTDSMCGMACDPQASQDPCGPCGTCEFGWLPPPGGALPRLPFSLAAQQGAPPGVCRADCTPEADGPGNCRDGYTCDPQLGVCVEACVNDLQCQVETLPSGDLTVNEDSPRTCDEQTGRCTFEGDPEASVGDQCETDADCPSNGLCIRNDTFPNGFCTKLYCDQPGFECSENATCNVNTPRLGATACLPGCQVGSQDDSGLQIGAGSGDDQCGEGEACYWDRTTEMDSAGNGGCFQGTFNDIEESNVGAACTSSDECYSPFGYGTCIFSQFEETTGMCSILDVGENAILPGVQAQGVCDPENNETPLRLSGEGEPIETACFKECSAASDCAEGHACQTLGQDNMGNDIKVCLPFCTNNDDCRGQCVGTNCDQAGTTCFCEGAMPPMQDGGVPDGGVTDAGVDGG